jgi:hypothetical protein
MPEQRRRGLGVLREALYLDTRDMPGTGLFDCHAHFELRTPTAILRIRP